MSMERPRMTHRAEAASPEGQSLTRLNGSWSQDGERRGIGDARTGLALGWFSVGLGLMEALAPRQTARFLGVPERTVLLRLLGLRELASGVGLLAQPDAAGWRWARVAGDLMDLALLAVSLPSDRKRVAAAMGAVLGVTAVDVAAGAAASRRAPQEKGPPRAVVTVGRPVEECIRSWTDPAVISRVLGPGHAFSPADETGRRLLHRPSGASKAEGGPVVTFESAPGGRGTVVRFEGEIPDLGADALESLRALPARIRARKILQRWKQLLETGMIPTTKGQPAGRRSAIGLMLVKVEE